MKDVFKEMYLAGESGRTAIEDKGFVQISDKEEISALVEELLQENAGQVDKHVKGKEQFFWFFCRPAYEKAKG